MRIRFIHGYFYPDLSAGSQIITDIAFYLSSQGHQVSVITSRGRYAGGGQSSFSAKEIVKGVSIRRVWSPSLGKGSTLERFLDQTCFAVGATIAALFARRADTVVVLTNPPLLAVLGLVLRRLKGERFVYVVMDLYPDVAIRAGLLKARSISARMMSWVTGMTIKGADRVVVLGTCMLEEVIGYGVDPRKAKIIHNWADEKSIRPLDPNENRFRKAHGLEGKFVIMYSGNMGVVHQFEDILEVARRLRGRSDICFVFIGDGVRHGELVDFQHRYGLKSILLLPYQDRSCLGESLGAGDLHFVSLRNGFEGLVVPSKVYGIMAAARPVVYQGSQKSDIGYMIAEKGIGVIVSEGDVNALESAILKLYSDRALTEILGKSARAVLEEEYSMQRAMDAYEDIFISAGLQP